MPSFPCRYHAIEHIPAEHVAPDDIFRRSDSERETHTTLRNERSGIADDVLQKISLLVDMPPAEAVSIEADLNQSFRTALAELSKHPALHHAEKKRAHFFRQSARNDLFFIFRLTTLRPAHSPLHRFCNLRWRRAIGPRVIQNHHHIDPQIELDLYGTLRREQMFGSIENRAKFRAFLRDPAHLGILVDKRIYLITPRIRKNRPVPTHKGVNAAACNAMRSIAGRATSFSNYIYTWLKHQMVRIHHERRCPAHLELI